MPAKDRDLIFKIAEQIKKVSTPPLTTYTPMTGEVNPSPVSAPNTYPRPAPPSTKG